MKRYTSFSIIALLFSAAIATSCSSEDDSIAAVEDENATLSAVPIIVTSDETDFDDNLYGSGITTFSDMTIDGQTTRVIRMPLRFVDKEEFYSAYPASRSTLDTYSTASEPEVRITPKSSYYDVSIKYMKMSVKYSTRDRYSFPDPQETESNYSVSYIASPDEYIGDPIAIRENSLHLAVSMKVYHKISDEYLKYSHSVGFTVRIQNNEFRIVDAIGLR